MGQRDFPGEWATRCVQPGWQPHRTAAGHQTCDGAGATS
jgi:hypothetical protein